MILKPFHPLVVTTRVSYIVDTPYRLVILLQTYMYIWFYLFYKFHLPLLYYVLSSHKNISYYIVWIFRQLDHDGKVDVIWDLNVPIVKVVRIDGLCGWNKTRQCLAWSDVDCTRLYSLIIKLGSSKRIFLQKTFKTMEAQRNAYWLFRYCKVWTMLTTQVAILNKILYCIQVFDVYSTYIGAVAAQ